MVWVNNSGIKKARDHFDIAIVGAGAVGGSLACALAQVGFSVALIERTAAGVSQQSVFDERHLGLSRSTRTTLQWLGLWSGLADAAVAVSRVHVSSKGHFGSVMMDARDEGLEALGYVLPAREIGRVLHQAISEQQNILLLAPAVFLSASTDAEKASICLDCSGEGVNITADLLIGADGVESQIRGQFGITTTRRDYGQSAVIANLDVRSPDTGLAFERFIEGGVVALLPRSADGYAVVFSMANTEADRLMAMSDSEFKAYIVDCLGGRINEVYAAGQRYLFPLAMVRAGEVVRRRLVLIGNAAHYIHPVAAQGFNLSMRDVAAVAETLLNARQSGKQAGDMAALQGYANWRKQDERLAVAFTDGLARLFVNPLPPAALLRQNSLLALRYSPFLRKVFARVVTGRLGKQAALIRDAGLRVNV